MLVLTNENKEKIKKHKELWSKIRDLIRSITKNSDDYDEKYLKIKFNLNDSSPLNKTIEILSMVIVVRAIFYENNKYYRQVFTNNTITNNITMIYYDRIDVCEEIDVNKTSASKEYDLCHYWYFSNFSFKFQPNVCNRCHDLLIISINLSDIAILNIKSSDYHCIISVIYKNEGINLLQNAWKKKEHYET